MQKRRFQSLHAANKSFNEKTRKYEQAATAILEFIPIVFVTTGRMHPVTRSLIADAIQRAVQGKGAFWISCLMLCVFKKKKEEKNYVTALSSGEICGICFVKIFGLKFE